MKNKKDNSSSNNKVIFNKYKISKYYKWCDHIVNNSYLPLREISLSEHISDFFFNDDVSSIQTKKEIEDKKQGKNKEYSYNPILFDDNGKHPRALTVEYLSNIEKEVRNSVRYLTHSTFIGKSHAYKNARLCYGFTIDLDGIKYIDYVDNLFKQIEKEKIPKPTTIVYSGNGLHLYYKFDNPVCFGGKRPLQLKQLLAGLYDIIWQPFKTTFCSRQQMKVLALTQSYRAIGSLTKFGADTRGFKVIGNDSVSLTYLNKFVKEEYKLGKSEIEHLETYKETHQSSQKNEKKDGSICVASSLKEKKELNKEKLTNHKFFLTAVDHFFKTKYLVGQRYFALLAMGSVMKKCRFTDEMIKEWLSIFYNYLGDNSTYESWDKQVKEDVLKATLKYGHNLKKETLNEYLMSNFQSNQKRNNLSRKEHLSKLRELNTGKKRKKGLKRNSSPRGKQKDSIITKLSKFNNNNQLTHEEIAKKFNCSVSLVKKHLKKGTKEKKFDKVYKLLKREFLKKGKVFTVREVQSFYANNKLDISLGKAQEIHKAFNSFIEDKKAKEIKKANNIKSPSEKMTYHKSTWYVMEMIKESLGSDMSEYYAYVDNVYKTIKNKHLNKLTNNNNYCYSEEHKKALDLIKRGKEKLESIKNKVSKEVRKKYELNILPAIQKDGKFNYQEFKKTNKNKVAFTSGLY